MTTKKTTITIFLVIIALATLPFFFKDGDAKKVQLKNNTIVAFGDSLTYGVGSTSGNDFVSLVSKKIGRPIINEGKSGDTTESALSRVDAVLTHNPGLVILLLGGNDYLRRVPKSTTFNNLGKIIERLKANGSVVLLLGVRGGLLKDNYEEDFKSLAKKYDLAYVPNVLDGLLGNREFMSDEIHPNDVGYEKISSRVVSVINSMIIQSR